MSNYQDSIDKINNSNEIKNLLNLLVKAEAENNFLSDFRENVTGKIVDNLLKFKGPLVKELSNGVKFHFIHQNKITRDFLLSSPHTPDHVWEPQTTKLLLHFSDICKHIIIGGAYIGDHAILIANKNKSCTVHTFEPNKESIEFLKKNIASNNIKNLVINEQALWDESDKMIILDGDDVLGTSIESNDTTNGIKTQTIDNYKSINKITKIDLIMLDIEGGEEKALKGAEITIENDKPIIVFETHSMYNDWSKGLENNSLISKLQDKGYKVFAIRDFHSNVNTKDLKIELIPAASTYIQGPPHGFNMLAIYSENHLQNPIFKVIENVSPKLFIDRKDKLFHPSEWL